MSASDGVNPPFSHSRTALPPSPASCALAPHVSPLQLSLPLPCGSSRGRLCACTWALAGHCCCPLPATASASCWRFRPSGSPWLRIAVCRRVGGSFLVMCCAGWRVCEPREAILFSISSCCSLIWPPFRRREGASPDQHRLHRRFISSSFITLPTKCPTTPTATSSRLLVSVSGLDIGPWLPPHWLRWTDLPLPRCFAGVQMLGECCPALQYVYKVASDVLTFRVLPRADSPIPTYAEKQLAKPWSR